jgi:hypothetical protein
MTDQLMCSVAARHLPKAPRRQQRPRAKALPNQERRAMHPGTDNTRMPDGTKMEGDHHGEHTMPDGTKMEGHEHGAGESK